MTGPRTYAVHLVRKHRNSVELRTGAPPSQPPPLPAAPARVALLLALAHDIDSKVRNGEIRDWADAARLCGFTRARASQICDLLLLAPDLQETLLFTTRPARGREPIGEQSLRKLLREPDWIKQRQMYSNLTGVKAP